MKVCEELWEISAMSGSMGSVATKGHVLEGHKEELPTCSTKLGSRRMGINQKYQVRCPEVKLDQQTCSVWPYRGGSAKL